MDVKGISLFTILDKNGAMIDLRLFFLTQQHVFQALFDFDKVSSAKEQKRGNDVLQKTKKLKNMKDYIRKVGREADDFKTQRVTAIMDKMASEDGSKAQIKIGKGDKKTFDVTIEIPQKPKGAKAILQIPFKGDPGNLGGMVFDGEASFITDGQRDIAKFLVDVVYDIGAGAP